MINFEKYIHTQTGRYILSILLGLGLASLFRSVCKGKNCLTFYAANIEDITNKIYKTDNKCYKYVPTLSKCSKDKKIINFA
jgi:hypothetical protein